MKVGEQGFLFVLCVVFPSKWHALNRRGGSSLLGFANFEFCVLVQSAQAPGTRSEDGRGICRPHGNAEDGSGRGVSRVSTGK